MNSPEGSLVLSASNLRGVAQHLKEAMREFERWGVKIGVGTRLPKTLEMLRQLSHEGSYPRDRERLALIGDAVRDAQEFIEIANVLPHDPIEAVVHDLGRAVRGDLQPPGPTGPHLQFQTQLWVAGMI